jgi:hypothetical protein
MTGKRANVAGIIVGRKATGKSTLACGYAEAYAKAHPEKKVLVIDVNGAPAYKHIPELTEAQFPRWRKGLYRFYLSDHARMFDLIEKHFRNGLIVFEDCTKYIPANPNQQIKAILVDHRMWNADLFFTFHSFKRIPNFFWEMTGFVVILKTQEEFNTSKNRNAIPNYEAVAAAHARVMKHKINYHHETVETLI